MLCGISCFYKNVLKRDEYRSKIPPRPRIKKLPSILSEEEVRRLFDVTSNLKHMVLLKTVYSPGLRLSEAICLKPEHIKSDPSRMMIRVEQGKANKDHYTILSRRMLPELHTYWRKYQRGEWLFPGHKRNRHMGSTTAYQIYKTVKRLRGHRSLKTTVMYLPSCPIKSRG